MNSNADQFPEARKYLFTFTRKVGETNRSIVLEYVNTFDRLWTVRLPKSLIDIVGNHTAVIPEWLVAREGLQCRCRLMN